MKAKTNSKTKITLFVAAVLALAALWACAPLFGAGLVAKANPTEVTDPYLHMPLAIATNGTQTVAYDTGTHSLKLIENGAISCIAQANEPIQMRLVQNDLFLLYNRTISVYDISSNLSQETVQNDLEQNFEFAFDVLSFDVFESPSGLLLVAQANNTANNLELQIYNLSKQNNKYTLTGPTTYISSTLGFQSDDIQNQVTSVAGLHNGQNLVFYCATQSNLHKITIAPNSIQSVSCVGAKTLATYQGGVAVQDNNGKITVFSADLETTHNFAGAYVSVAAAQDKLIASENENMQVLQLLPEPQVVFQNNNTLPQNFLSGQDLCYATTTQATTLKTYPYSLSGLQIETQTQLVVLHQASDEFLGQTYVTFVKNGQNQYGFVNSEHILPLTDAQTNYKLRAFIDTQATTLPSTICDSTNQSLFEIKKDEELTIIGNAAGITNGGKSFFLAKNSEQKIGFVEAGHLGTLLQNNKPKKETNATTTTETVLFQNQDGTVELLKLAKGTRVFVVGKLNPQQAYTKVIYQTSDGAEITGYIATEHLASDGLTTLQIVGIVLLVVNTFVLVLVLAYYSYARKKTNKAI